MNKPFDCVEMKRRCQEALRSEYEARRGEFDSYFDFIRAKANASDWVRRSNEKLTHARPGKVQ